MRESRARFVLRLRSSRNSRSFHSASHPLRGWEAPVGMTILGRLQQRPRLKSHRAHTKTTNAARLSTVRTAWSLPHRTRS